MTKSDSGHDSIITFTSDFGTTDGYVGIVKGSICNINRDATIIDLAHEIRPFDVRAGAWIIYNSYRF
ncbi:MAG TPA: SAM-dependent chlorinase/fluorinase, partial [Candidatus Melainabacteria bacterium]|nr:SAM-dependent chlorinase/fluorinase [Candidatus Melainabacteria bacterium]